MATGEGTSALRALWAKTDGELWHPLVCHLIDVGTVCRALLNTPSGMGIAKRLGRLWGVAPEQAVCWTAFFAALHDMGKACAAFQIKRPEHGVILAAAGLTTKTRQPQRMPHASVTAVCLPRHLEGIRLGYSLSQGMARHIARVLGGHHGVFPSAGELNSTRNVLRRDEQRSTWPTVRAMLVDRVAKTFLPESIPAPELAGNPNTSAALLAGIVTFSDWLGSDNNHFPYAEADVDLGAYRLTSKEHAQKALEVTSWNRAPAAAQRTSFQALFPHIREPRPLQVAAEKLADSSDLPALVIIEAPMGEGKTEAALLLQQAWMRSRRQRGCYFALPTMATSNQLFQRIAEFVRRISKDSHPELHLLHSHATLNDDYAKLRVHSIDPDAPLDAGSVVAHDWFMSRKRGLLAPSAVGTVDQALMAVLQVRHGYLRLFGLSEKTLVFDEVHAYDVHMLTLFERLVDWLRALDCTVVILSATLPKARTMGLFEKYTGQAPRVQLAGYPRITCAYEDGRVASHGFDASEERHVTLHWQARDLEALARMLRNILADGGCVAWICNTVRSAQETYCHLRAALSADGIDVDLFHARYPFGERSEREKRCLDRFGPVGNRPHRSVLVATQVIEQSLDLDFDLMISEVAPIDLVLQRTGRLHRHNRSRPAILKLPTLWLLEPEVHTTGLPVFPRVYDRAVMLRSWLVLRDRRQLEFPADLDQLVEVVYGGHEFHAEESVRVVLQELELRRESGDERVRFDARVMEICHPEDGDLLLDFNRQLTEDTPEAHRTLQARTRVQNVLSAQLICLHLVNGTLCFDEAGSQPYDLAATPDQAMTRRLLEHGVNLPNWGNIYDQLETPPAWKKNALLRHSRVALFQNRTCEIDEWTLRWDAQLGIALERTTEEGNADESEL